MAPIDPVRYITNRSSGKMGYEIAKEARDRGAEVTLISGPTNLEKPFGINVIDIKTNGDMLNEVTKHFNEQDIIIKAAAVADFKPKTYSDRKIKKSSTEEFSLELEKDTDILKKLGQIKKQQILVGFAAESNDLIKNATSKLNKKNLDFIIANDITKADTGFASNDNKVTILCSDGRKICLEKMAKKEVAKNIFDLILNKQL